MPTLDGKRAAVACIHIPNFMWQVESLRRPELADRPVIIVGESGANVGKGAQFVLDWSPELGQKSSGTSSQKFTRGMPLSEALADARKDVTLLEPDIPLYRRIFAEVLTALEARCPDVEPDTESAESYGLGRAYVGIWGLERLYGDDAQVVRALSNAVNQFDARIGVGENKWLAYIAASASSPGRGLKITGEPGRFLAKLPVELLPVDFRLITRLHGFGLHTMGDIAALPPGAMQAQFGGDGTLVSDLSNGIDQRPLVARRTEEAVSEYLEFPDATVSMAMILPAIESLLSRAYNRPQLARRYAREAKLEAGVLRRPPWTIRVAFKEPAGSRTKALFSIKSKMDDLALPGPIEDMRLTLSGLTGEAGRQESLWTEVRRDQKLQEAVSQLEARLGTAPPVYQVRELEPWSRIPERRHALVQLSP
ncbi:MAG TPA: hypothetical protein QGI07_09555 [Dehalococcoidia bacterium]|jgi:DNA polymerase-4/protein ImuB|nr:hypothetical protein [Chloroflexota bacterium]MDP5876520.1 hypothetical protein [Dehalococcoidia bacterium]MDP6273566.1 hypothetical protein [Dehalococcoidia bacterium]MDP7160891.1 hypothetical protein [Dehalococcoidia bacterium]MDP7515230.1 hypothetical protein [Dehalococcoidia bacterium]|tara:strand:+ start:747 stop:2015 length:1269 start_codon:yes stop_codon:yes gene_type:complete